MAEEITDEQIRQRDAANRAKRQAVERQEAERLTPKPPPNFTSVKSVIESLPNVMRPGCETSTPGGTPELLTLPPMIARQSHHNHTQAAEAPAPSLCPECDVTCTWEQSRPAVPPMKPNPSWQRSLCRCEEERAEAFNQRAEENRHAEAERTRLQARFWAFRDSDIEGRMKEMTFANFDPSRSDTAGAASMLLQEWAARLDKDTRKGYALYSPQYGCGKTHLAVATAAAVCERSIGVRVVTMTGLLDSIRSEFDRPGAGRGKEMEAAIAAPVLVVDDFGTERIAPGERGDWTREQIFMLFDSRWRAGRPLIVTTNLTTAEIESRIGGDHGGRVVSRLLGMAEWFPMDGPDGRLQG